MPARFSEGFSVREPAWHGMAKVLPDYIERKDAIVAAGHDFTVSTRPVYVPAGVTGGQAQELGGAMAEQPLFKAVVRDDTGKVLNIARDTYTLVQNDVAWDVLDAIAETDKAVKYETAGVLDDGGTCWVMAKVDEPLHIDGDPSLIYPYMTAAWSHDGSSSLRIMRNIVRVVCWNTLSAAEGEAEKGNLLFSFRHTRSVHDRITAAKEVLAGVRTGFRVFAEMAEDLAAQTVSDEGIEAFIRAFIPKPAEHLVSERVEANVEDARAIVRSYFASETTEGIRNTAWGLFNAGVEYLDYGRGFRSTKTLMNRTVLRADRAKVAVETLARRAAASYPAK